MTHNETLEFLITQGWENRTSKTDKVLRPNWFDPDKDEQEWYSVEDALNWERQHNPEEYHEFELLTNLDSRSLTLVNEYFES